MYFWRCVNTSVFMNHFHFVSFFQLFCPICSNFSTVFHYRFKILLLDCFQSNSLVCDPLSVFSRQCWCSSAPMNADAIELDDNFLFRITQAFFFYSLLLYFFSFFEILSTKTLWLLSVEWVSRCAFNTVQHSIHQISMGICGNPHAIDLEIN